MAKVITCFASHWDIAIDNHSKKEMLQSCSWIKGNSEKLQKEWRAEHESKAWLISSLCNSQIGQDEIVSRPLLTKAVLVGMIPLQARQRKDLNLGGTFSFQISCQVLLKSRRALSLALPWRSVASLKHLYPVLTSYCPFLEYSQNNESREEDTGRGISQIALAKSWLNKSYCRFLEPFLFMHVAFLKFWAPKHN